MFLLCRSVPLRKRLLHRVLVISYCPTHLCFMYSEVPSARQARVSSKPRLCLASLLAMQDCTKGICEQIKKLMTCAGVIRDERPECHMYYFSVLSTCWGNNGRCSNIKAGQRRICFMLTSKPLVGCEVEPSTSWWQVSLKPHHFTQWDLSMLHAWNDTSTAQNLSC